MSYVNNQELNRERAEWAGFMYRSDAPLDVIVGGKVWRYPDGTCHKHLPDFPHSLDACFKWLVPKLRLVSIEKDNHEGNWRVFVAVDDYSLGHWISGEVNAETPALALCLAILKLIEGEKDVNSNQAQMDKRYYHWGGI